MATAIADTSRQWWEFTVEGHPLLEELIIWRLQESGCPGSASQLLDGQLRISTYLNPQQFQERDLIALEQQLQADVRLMDQGQLVTQWQLVAELDWAKSWQEHWRPQPIGERLLINPAWLPLPDVPGRQVLQLNPGVAFGTGAHATTQLCLRALEVQLARQAIDQRVAIADIGCGSGVLSIAAILLGADRAYAVDTDPLAVDAARESRDLNGIEAQQMVVALGSCDRATQLTPEPVDGFVCNILADVILTLIPQFQALVKPGGWGLLSGILTRQQPEMIDQLAQQGWQVLETATQADWCCLCIQQQR